MPHGVTPLPLTNQMFQRAAYALSYNLTVYGTIRSFDRNTNTVELETINQYKADDQPIILTLHILPEAFIGRQNLIMENGIYVGVSSTTPLGSTGFDYLVPNTRVKFVVINRGNDGNAIVYLLIGNPL